MRDGELEAHYLRYLDCLNDRRLDDLGQFTQDNLVYNDEPKTAGEYRDLIAASIRAIPDLVFQVDLLVVQREQVACRLRFDCTPEREFLGLRPTGASVSFAEHVFYRFTDGKIAHVRSLIDRAALAAQLVPGPGRGGS